MKLRYNKDRAGFSSFPLPLYKPGGAHQIAARKGYYVESFPTTVP